MTREGHQLDRYHLRQLLGCGGMGDACLAEDPRVGLQVAIKGIRAEISPYPSPQAREKAAQLFHRKAKAIVKLGHPNILPLFAYGETALGQATCAWCLNSCHIASQMYGLLSNTLSASVFHERGRVCH